MDHLSNLFTSIRNAELAGHSELSIPHTKHSLAILAVLKQEGYVSNYQAVGDTAIKQIAITLPQPVTRHHYKLISKPGRRLYTSADKIPTVLRGLGAVIVSTPKGVMTGKQARRQKVGGELIAEVY